MKYSRNVLHYRKNECRVEIPSNIQVQTKINDYMYTSFLQDILYVYVYAGCYLWSVSEWCLIVSSQQDTRTLNNSC